MDRDVPLLGELEHDDLEQVSREIRPDDEDLGWIGVRLEIGDDQRMLDGVTDVVVAAAVLACRSSDLHTGLVYYVTCLAARTARPPIVEVDRPPAKTFRGTFSGWR